MYIALFLAGIIASGIMTAVLYKKIEAGKLIIVSMMNYFSAYIILSGLLIWFDKYSLIGALILSLVVSLAIASGVFIFAEKKMPEITGEIKKYLPLILICAVSVILSWNKSELFSTSQDQGLYQIQAMMYISGENGNHHVLEEYYELPTEELKAEYLRGISELEGVYFTNATYGIEGCGTEYEVHGIGTYAALLALWGKMFGTGHMAGIQTLFYMLTICGVWLICENLGLKRSVSYMTAILTGLCPIILWCSKTVLTEIVLCMLICMFFVYVTENIEEDVTALCGLPIVAYCYYHITVTIMMPLWVIAIVIMYLYSKKNGLFYSLIAVLLGYTTGMEMMYKSSPFYTQKNLEPIIRVTKGLFTIDNFHKVVFAVCIGLCVLAAILHFSKILEKLRDVIQSRDFTKNKKVRLIISTAITLMFLAFYIYTAFKTNAKHLEISKMSVFSFLFMTGFIMLPIALFSFVKKIDELVSDGGKLIIAVSMLYSVLVLTGLIWSDIYYYFYYARYFAPYMMLVLIMAALVLNEINMKVAVSAYVIAGLAVIISCPVVYTETDLKYGDYEVVQGVASEITDTDAVIMYADVMGMHKMMMLPVKILSGCDVYLAGTLSAEDMAMQLSERYANVYLLIYDAGYQENELSPWTRIYHDTLKSSFYEKYGDTLPYPTDVSKFESTIGLLQFK